MQRQGLTTNQVCVAPLHAAGGGRSTREGAGGSICRGKVPQAPCVASGPLGPSLSNSLTPLYTLSARPASHPLTLPISPPLQLLAGGRKGGAGKPRKPKYRALQGHPCKRGICLRVYTTAPKKPNSANRKVGACLGRGRSAEDLPEAPSFE